MVKPPAKKTTTKPATKAVKVLKKPPAKKTEPATAQTGVAPTWQELFELFGLTIDAPKVDEVLLRAGQTISHSKRFLSINPHGASIMFAQATALNRSDLPPTTRIVELIILSIQEGTDGQWKGGLPFDLPRDLTLEGAKVLGSPVRGFLNEVDIKRGDYVLCPLFHNGTIREIHCYSKDTMSRR